MKIKIVLSCIIIFVLMLAVNSSAFSEDRIYRTVLAVYDSSDEETKNDDNNFIRNNLEVVLNYLGMKVVYHDIQKGIPSKAQTDEIIGILSWFRDDSIPMAEEYCEWVLGEIKKGKKFIILGSFGAFIDSNTQKNTPIKKVEEVFIALGLEYDGDWTDNPFVIRIEYQDKGMTEFERTLVNEINVYERIGSINPKNKVYLSLSRSDVYGSKSDLVVVTPSGGYAMDEYVMLYDYASGQVRWRIDPFSFISEALALEDIPTYDTTTLFGQRIFYSHIDGDGFRNLSEVDREKFSSEIILEEIINKYKLPITASFISADIDPKYFGSERLFGIAKKIAFQNNVEVGVHGFSHPLDWAKKLTAYKIKGYSRIEERLDDSELKSESNYGEAAKVIVSDKEYIEREIFGASDYLNKNLMPEDKKVAINQWTGNCEPTEAAIIGANNSNLFNINGGDGRIDRYYSSYTNFSPLSRKVGNVLQFFTSSPNENIYTNEWGGPYDGYINVIETFKETEYPTFTNNKIPRRVAPINVYYHFYSGEKKQSLEALKKVYEYASSQKIIPIFTSEYISIVKGFMSGKEDKVNDGGWKFSNYGDCRTIRVNGKEKYPDLKKSKGIIGYSYWENYTYIYLTNTNEAILFFSDFKTDQPYLREATAIIYDISFSKLKIDFSSRVFYSGKYVFSNMLPRTMYNVSYEKEKNLAGNKSIKSDNEGNIKFEINGVGVFKIKIESVK